MTIFFSALAGIIQGISEFLPISSTAHLTLFGRAFSLISTNDPEQWTAYIAILQLGTLGAVLAYFRREIWDIALAFLHENVFRPRGIRSQGGMSRMGWMLILGTIPVGIIGILIKHQIEGAWTKNIAVIASAQIIFALLLWAAERSTRHQRAGSEIGWKDALGIGVGQVFALVPGASRSGTTLTAALLLGINRSDAARFSFLLSIPAVFLSGVLEFVSSFHSLTTDMAWAYGAGIITAFFTGYASIAFLIRYLQRNTTNVFIAYRILLGTGLLLAIFTGGLQA